MNLKVQMIIAVKETTEAVAEKTEKDTVLNRTRTHNRSIACAAHIELSSRPGDG